MRVACALVLVALLVPVVARAEDLEHPVDESPYKCDKREADVEITFKSELELKDLLSWVVGFTCKKFVLDPKLVMTGRKVTLIAPGKQSPAQAYDMFLTALGTMGYTVVPKGKLLLVTESATGRGNPLPWYRDGKLPDGTEQMVRYLFRPQYAQVETFRQAVSAFKSDAGDVQVIGSMVLATDHGSNVRDMAAIAKLVDVPGGTDGIYAIPVHHADAAKLADKLGSLMEMAAPAGGGKRGPADGAAAHDPSATPTKLVVDERTNTLLVTGTESAFQRVKALVERLDIDLAAEGGASMHVYQLGNAIAEELAKTVNDAIAAQQGQGQGQPTHAAAPASPTEIGQLEGPAKVIADKATNKLLVMASGRDFLAIRDVIRQLDVPRKQVYIEAMIMELNLSNELRVGTSGHTVVGANDGNAAIVAGVQAPDLRSTSVGSVAASSGLIGGILGKALTGTAGKLLGTTVPSYGVLFQALSDTSRTNILSSMPIIVLDNETAKYKVGTNVPYKKGVIPTTTATTNTTVSTNIEREPLLLELEIKPHISTDDSVLLEVKQSSKDIGDTSSELGPTWTERGVETRVLVPDQQTIVIGGLVQTRDQEVASKVPLLGDIPVLGHLFKYTRKTKSKMNLLILLTPYIVKDNLDLEAIRSRKQREYDEFVHSMSSLDGKPYVPKMDYRRKRGLIEEINRAVLDVEDEAAARAALRQHPVEVTPGLVEPHRDAQ